MEISGFYNKCIFSTTFENLHPKNNPRFGFLVKFWPRENLYKIVYRVFDPVIGLGQYLDRLRAVPLLGQYCPKAEPSQIAPPSYPGIPLVIPSEIDSKGRQTSAEAVKSMLERPTV